MINKSENEIHRLTEMLKKGIHMDKNTKILLAMLPFNDPQVPPLGLANLKSRLTRENYLVKTVDANTDIRFRELFDGYFQLIWDYIPGNKRGNFYSMRLDVWQNQLMAYLTYRKRLAPGAAPFMKELETKDEKSYIQLIKLLVYKTFFITVNDGLIYRLDEIVKEFYTRLEDYILGLVREESPGILGLSVCTAMLAPSLFAFKRTKEKYPHIKTVMGGGIFADDLALDSKNLDYLLEKTHYIDKLIVGEGELLMLKYLRGELPESQRVYSIKDLDNEVVDLAAADIPDFSDFKVDYYPYLPANASLGCPFHCGFCTIPNQWGRYRRKSAAQVARELIRLYEMYNCQLFLMVDSLLNPLMTELALEFINLGTAIYWDGSLKISEEVCDTEKTLLWRQGGFYRAHIGVETGAQRLLDLMDKRITVEQIKKGITSLARAGIKTTTFWVVGYPGETEEDFQQTLKLVTELRDDIFETTIRPYLYYEMKQSGPRHSREKDRSILLYPENTKEKLLMQTWINNSPPSREETFLRLNRFNDHIRKLGVPNPYSLYELNQADQRWKQLHGNAVPSLIEIKDRDTYIDECKQVEKIFYLLDTLEDDGEFGI
jgi:radical SAM superfamily enzyme YgiQ (UPF0313 family)